MVACWHLARREKLGKSDRIDSTWNTHKERGHFFDAHAMKTWEQTPDPRWSLKEVTLETGKRRWQVYARCICCAQTCSLFSVTKMPSHIFSGCPGSLMHINIVPLTLPATVNSSTIYVLTHTYTQNEQQRLLMSRNAHRSVKQHDSCHSRGSSYWTAAANGAPPIRQWHAWLFPPRVC